MNGQAMAVKCELCAGTGKYTQPVIPAPSTGTATDNEWTTFVLTQLKIDCPRCGGFGTTTIITAVDRQPTAESVRVLE